MMLFVDHELASRIEAVEAAANADYVQAMLRLGPDSSPVSESIADGIVTYVAPGLPLNRAIGLGMRSPVRSIDLDRVERFYRERRAPALVDVCPLADPTLSDLLSRRGYRIVRFFNTMVRPLTVADARSDHASTGVDVRVAGPTEADLWATTAAQGFAGQANIPGDDLNLLLARLAARRPGVTCFLATIEGTPAGAAGLLLRDGMAVLFSGSTRPEFRRRGVQSALIQARLLAAAESGGELALSGPLPGTGSQHNLQRHEFAVAYTRHTMMRDLD